MVLPISLADFLWPDFLWLENSGESRESNEIYFHAGVAPRAGRLHLVGLDHGPLVDLLDEIARQRAGFVFFSRRHRPAGVPGV